MKKHTRVSLKHVQSTLLNTLNAGTKLQALVYVQSGGLKTRVPQQRVVFHILLKRDHCKSLQTLKVTPIM